MTGATPHRFPRWLRLGAALVALGIYGLMLGLVHGGGPVGADSLLLSSVAEYRGPTTTTLMVAATQMGSAWMLTILTTVGVLLIWRASRRSAIFLVLTVAGAGALNQLVKELVARPRPTEPLYAIAGYSFPSGHSMAAVAFFLALVLMVRQHHYRLQWQVAAIALPLVALIGTTRVYLGVHYPSDVVGGWALGAVWVAAVYSWYRKGFVPDEEATETT